MTKVLAITQARSGSTRLPAKVFKEIQGKKLLALHIERAKQSRLIDVFHVATTTSENDAAIVELATECGVPSSRGSEDNVLDRYYQAAVTYQPEWVVRVTSDCPLVDPKLIDEVIQYAFDHDADYCANTLIEAYPDGQDIEVFRFSALEKAWKEAELASDKEHVTPFIKRNSDFNGGRLFKAVNYPCDGNYNKVRMCVDEPIDLEVMSKLIELEGLDKDWLTYTKTYLDNEEIRSLNENITRNEGYLKSLKEDTK
ncbi:MAG: glycosyltransferase family protein [Flavobacteriales bacterium]|nr:glycosyltransferase family protein [Flavobacteriales bacterium]